MIASSLEYNTKKMIPKIGLVKSAVLRQFQPAKSTWAQAEIARLLDCYDLGEWKLGKELGGGNSDNLILHTDSGKKVIKRYYWSLEKVIHEHSILTRLFSQDNDFPSPRLVTRNDGDTLTSFGGRNYALYDFVSGFCCSRYYFSKKTSNNFTAQAAEMLAHFHKIMGGFVPDGMNLTGLMPEGKTLWRGNGWLFKVLDEFCERGSGSKLYTDQEQYILNRIDTIKDNLTGTGKHHELAGSYLPRCIIHGDYAPYNLLYDKSGLRSILDFGGSNLNLRVADIARALITFTMSNNHKINTPFAKVFLNSYIDRQALLNVELLAILDIMVWSNLRIIVWSLFDIRENARPAGKTFKIIQFHWERVLAIQSQANEVGDVLSPLL